jgi:phosphate:Na+ symporter
VFDFGVLSAQIGQIRHNADVNNETLAVTAEMSNTDLMWTPLLIGLFGGVALLLYGLRELTRALRGVAGDKLRLLLARLTRNRASAVVTGAATTAILQSSTITTVLVVGFVGAGVMTLTASLGVILGSNVGTTLTAQVVAFDIAEWALAIVGAGFLAMTISKNEKIEGWGTAVLGLGFVFLGIQVMSSAMEPLRSYGPFVDTMARMETPLVGAAAGIAFTAVIQSSSATTVLAIVLASQGLLPLSAGVAIVIGANIGTCFTAGLAAIGRSRDAQRAAAAHVLFNVVGGGLWLVLLGPLLTVTTAISPSHPDLAGAARLAAEVPRQLANAHTIFNVANVILFFGLLGPTAVLLGRLLPERTDRELPESTPRHLETELLGTPSLALDAARREVGRLGELVLRMLLKAPNSVLAGDRASLVRLAEADNDVDVLYDHIVGYLRRLLEGSLTPDESHEMLTLLEVSNALESIGDLVEQNLVALGHRRLDNGLQMSGATLTVLRELFASVNKTVSDAIEAVVHGDEEAAGRVMHGKRSLNQRLDAARGHQVTRLLASEGHRSRLYAIETDVIEIIKRVEYLARHVVEPRVPLTEPPDLSDL